MGEIFYFSNYIFIENLATNKELKKIYGKCWVWISSAKWSLHKAILGLDNVGWISGLVKRLKEGKKTPQLHGREQSLCFSVKITWCSVTGCNCKYC